MKLIDNWKEVLLKSMANWAAYVGVASGLLDIAHPAIAEMLPQLKQVLSPDAYFTVMFVCLVVAPALRVIDQGLSTLVKPAKGSE